MINTAGKWKNVQRARKRNPAKFAAHYRKTVRAIKARERTA